MIEVEQLREDAYAMLLKADEISKEAETDYNDFIENCPCQEMVEIGFWFDDLNITWQAVKFKAALTWQAVTNIKGRLSEWVPMWQLRMSRRWQQ